VETSVNELYATMARLTGTGNEAVYAPARPGEVVRSALDPRLAGTELGWKPATALEVGLSATLDWFRSRPPAPRPPAT
jgi:UDP-glucose 4-epimerase